MLAERDLLDVEDDVGDILAHAGDRGKLVQHAVEHHRGDRRALKRGEQHAAKRVAEGKPEPALERLSHDESETLRVAAQRDVELSGLDEILPVFLQHLEGPFLVLKRGRLPQLAKIRGNMMMLNLRETRRRLRGRQPLCGIGVRFVDGDDGEARGLQRPKRRFTAGARPANLDFEILHAC